VSDDRRRLNGALGDVQAAEPISVLVVDGQPLVRERAAQAIEADKRLELAGVAADGHEALEKVRELRPNAVLLDIFMPRMGGDEVLRVVRTERIEVKVLVLTAYPTAELHDALQLQPDALLFKEASCDQVCEEIVAIMRGEEHSPGRVALREATALAVARAKLTHREQLVLGLAAEGLKARETAERLFVSKRVVEGYLRDAREKLEAPTTTAAVAKAYEIGLLGKRRLG
jgi:DNA-binding NarL/FixJ family response regulator